MKNLLIQFRIAPAWFALLAWMVSFQPSPAAETSSPALPWERELPLKQAARDAALMDTLNPKEPAQGAGPGRLEMNNFQMRSSVWGPSSRVTLSLLKDDVWDRRCAIVPAVTLAEVSAGAYALTNKGIDDMPPNHRRPVRGYLPADGSGRTDPYTSWNAYPFPCQKPVGQIILGLDELAGAASPKLAQACADGVVRFELKNERARADLEMLLSMTRNVQAIRGRLEGVAAPWLRLYRHEDQAWRRYMTDDKKAFRFFSQTADKKPFDYTKDAAWNGPIEPPTSGTDGRFFWIRQRLPAEKTFPKGFDYVLMGLVAGPGKPAIQTADGKLGLGTPAFGGSEGLRQGSEEAYKAIREAPGATATASLTPDPKGNVTVYVTVVTCNDAPEPMAEAKRQLEAAAALGFDGLVAENARWYSELYDRRENGRIFTSAPNSAAESAREAFSSWYIRHGANTKPDMRRFEATASYTGFERDWQLWHSLPCYNEIFYTPVMVRNRADSADMWWKLIDHWREASRANAREVYGLTGGMALVHGYLPPIKADRYVHVHVALEYSIDTIAQMVKVLWDEWDYGGDENFLRQKAYPALRDTAIFYANYARKGADGCYHFIPSMEAEAWGIFPEFKRAKDCISALCMARWTFDRAVEASELLGVDANLRKQWVEIEEHLPPYPTYETPNGPIFNTVADTIPSWKQGDHGWFVALYPTLLADEINLDSSAELRSKMIRTITGIPSPRDPDTLLLLGASKPSSTFERAPEALLNSRSGRLHLFPDTPANAVVAFRKFQARGAFLVSAVKDATGVSFVEIEARRDIPCQIMNPWPGRSVSVVTKPGHKDVSFTVDRRNGECLIVPAHRGETYIIQPNQT
jgi:hypothetical protein